MKASNGDNLCIRKLCPLIQCFRLRIYNKINKDDIKKEDFLKKVEDSIPQLISRKLQRWLTERPKAFKRDFWKEWTCIMSLVIQNICYIRIDKKQEYHENNIKNSNADSLGAGVVILWQSP
jgi:hypothetical protein